ncbi:MAG: hypothetical protein ACRDTH_00255 [Pseudonocardiaceae bacterium]
MLRRIDTPQPEPVHSASYPDDDGDTEDDGYRFPARIPRAGGGERR